MHYLLIFRQLFVKTCDLDGNEIGHLSLVSMFMTKEAPAEILHDIRKSTMYHFRS